MSVLPVTKGSLKYGSSDSGQTIHADIEELNEKMQRAAERINLKGHVTGYAKHKKMIYGPGDIEGHLGTDGRYYVVDFGRTLPPEDPRIRRDATKRSIFYHLLRSELVKANPVPLCSDAYSSWNSDDNEQIRDQNNQDVTEATHRLYNEIIPEFARYLDTNDGSQQHNWDKLLNSSCKADIKLPLKWILGKHVIHSKGINLRHLVGY
jgi:hypothetical protein